mmetsp:Transcript_6402/g.26190  ORF Transcript_6402/g.26190 Transcript_6402/m.26190 type:complete len:216 (-) Transcript_6402:239-886(-)
MHEVDAGTGAVVGADRGGRARAGDAALVLGPGTRVEHRAATPAHAVAQIGRGVGFDQPFGQRRGLDQQEPVPVGAREGLGRALVHGQRRRDVEQHQPRDRLGVVQRQPVGHPRTAVVRQHREALVAEGAHQGHGVPRHLALGIGGAAVAGGRPVAVAIAAQVHQHDAALARQRRRHAVPHRHRLRMAVRQQQGRQAGVRRPGLARKQRDAIALEG